MKTTAYDTKTATWPGLTRHPSLHHIAWVEIDDAAVGLKPDTIAQLRAEEYIRAALAFKERQAQKSRKAAVRTIRVALPMQLAELDEPAFTLDEIAVIAEPTRSRWSDEPLSSQ